MGAFLAYMNQQAVLALMLAAVAQAALQILSLLDKI